MEQLLAADAEDVGDDPVLARLLPDGHRGDPEIAADYRELTESVAAQWQGRRPGGRAGDAAGRRRDVRLDVDQAAAWLRSTNDLRLALGTRLDIREDTEPPEEITGEEDQQLAVYYWLTAMQGSLVDALVDARSGRS